MDDEVNGEGSDPSPAHDVAVQARLAKYERLALRDAQHRQQAMLNAPPLADSRVAARPPVASGPAHKKPRRPAVKWTVWIGVAVTLIMLPFGIGVGGWYVAPMLGIGAWAFFAVIDAFWTLWDRLGEPTPAERDLRYIADEVRVTRGKRPLGPLE